MGRLDGHVAIVTGAGRQRGIGRATALKLASEGAAVVVSAVARSPDYFPAHEREAGWKGARSVADEIVSNGGRAIAIDCDVTKRAEVEKLIGETLARFGAISSLVNNAGVASDAGAASILDMDDELWNRTLEINLTGTYLPSKLAGREMVKAGNGGAIVNLSSLAGRQGIANYGAYCTTKFGVIGFTQQLARELAPHGIRVNCVAPGTTDTDMMDGTFTRTAAGAGLKMANVKAGVSRSVPLGRQGRVEEQAAAIAFLISPDASYITGQTINVDGGVRMD
jgi:3-oxoacyl-[acyl-carrier protein] reductase/meso-butanediol dehydrogenase/(S,S)-butanediol dehydrogenase/diacetyl reductase